MAAPVSAAAPAPRTARRDSDITISCHIGRKPHIRNAKMICLLCNELHSIMAGMALEHAILVSLLEQPGSGYELARRFERSIGRFWTATHQQIYRVLKRMESDGWISAEEIGQDGRPDKRAYSVAPTGRDVLTAWLRDPVQ